MVHSHREGIDQGLPCLRRTHRYHGALGAVLVLQLDCQRNRAKVECADYRRPIALDGLGFGIEVRVFDEGNLLNANSDFEHEHLLFARG